MRPSEHPIRASTSSPLQLKVFQASPLAYDDYPIPFLDLDEEEKMLKEALKGTSVDVSFEIATAHSLSTFLAQGKSFLHLSCHGHPNQLFIEDGYGGCHILIVGENLKRWINNTAGGTSLNFVFVAACHSRSVGESFLDAGVPWVVCCEQDGYQLLDQAARTFARIFYNAVANGATLQGAFDLAKSAVVQSREVQRVGGIDPQVEANKFVLLSRAECEDNKKKMMTSNDEAKEEMEESTEQEIDDASAFRRHSAYASKRIARDVDLSSLKATISRESSSVTLSMIPVPPCPFLERELEMYGILRCLFIERNKARLVRLAGDRGVGKVAVAKAIAQYVKKRNMWGEILWLPPPLGVEADSSMFEAITQTILETYQDEKAMLIINSTQFAQESIKALCTFLDNIFERTKYIKVILIQDTKSQIDSQRYPVMGFTCFQVTVTLAPLSRHKSAELFCYTCDHMREWRWGAIVSLMNKMMTDDVAWQLLGEGNPTKIVLMAKKITGEEFKRLSNNEDGPLQIDDFKHSLENVKKIMSDRNKASRRRHFGASPEQGNQLKLKNVVISSKQPTKAKPPPLRAQEEIIDRFAPMLRNEGKVYRKSVPSFIRKAIKGEHIVTVINGTVSSEHTVKDDCSWVVCGHVANEYYAISNEKFHEIYDTKNPNLVPRNNPHHDILTANGFKEYRSKRKVWAHQVTKEDMSYFRHGSDCITATKEAFFMAPWGTPTRVEEGDYIVLQYPDGVDDMYRIEGALFARSYVDINQTSVQQADYFREETLALEERMAVYSERNPDFAPLEADIRSHIQELMSALGRAGHGLPRRACLSLEQRNSSV